MPADVGYDTKDQEGQTTQTICAAGAITSKEGTAKCTACPTGKKAEAGKKCVACAPGYVGECNTAAAAAAATVTTR